MTRQPTNWLTTAATASSGSRNVSVEVSIEGSGGSSTFRDIFLRKFLQRGPHSFEGDTTTFRFSESEIPDSKEVNMEPAESKTNFLLRRRYQTNSASLTEAGFTGLVQKRKGEAPVPAMATISFISEARAPIGYDSQRPSKWEVEKSLRSSFLTAPDTEGNHLHRLTIPMKTCKMNRPYEQHIGTTRATVRQWQSGGSTQQEPMKTWKDVKSPSSVNFQNKRDERSRYKGD
ncbi:hypothetical protein BCR39DRAFT_375873 [Naematelia encephala]|uniref:Uncharacterized protein n=1 Tax=Naematelia encephala TaxID=71784 RepID=A0A1Y2BCG8_9TREE|nr:hypothetical protein BCR39DRAFT_375873 [Naematelia encephala]